jgi:ABC-2 type transport system permease protein
MRTLKFLLQKEFRQIFRDPINLRIMFMMPVMQLMVLPWAADYETKNIQISIVDHDHSTYSRSLTARINASTYFKLVDVEQSFKESLKQVEQDNADIVLEIPASFEKTIVRENEASLFLAVNAINGVKANLGSVYLRNIIQDFNRDVRLQWILMPRFNAETQINVTYANWFNPLMNYKFFMVPGILVLLLTMVGTNLAAINIVKEKEIGTIEQINVTPIRKYHFIIGKLIPFWCLGMIILSIGLLIARLFYGIIPAGSFVTIYVFAAVYMVAVLGLGLLLSTYAANQQQAMLLSFFMLMIFILMSGLYTSIESMPEWAQWITRLNPISYFISVMRAVVLKGSTLADIQPQLRAICVFAIVLNAWAIINYRKRS